MSTSIPVIAARRARRRRHDESGFTLIELAVVVVIVGILAVIAVVGYRRYILHSKISEAQAVISGIRIAQEDYRAEKGAYLNVGPNPCPAGAGTGTVKVQWDPNCSGGAAAWKMLPVHVDGPVQFAYASTASAPDATPGTIEPIPDDAKFVDFSKAKSLPWYVISASCDLDGNGGLKTKLAGMSFTNQIFSANEGE